MSNTPRTITCPKGCKISYRKMKKEMKHHRIRSFCIISILVIPIFIACTKEKSPSNIYDAETYSKRASSHYNEGKYDQAIADHSKTIEINPKDSDAYYNRANANFYKKEYEKAWDDVYKAQKLGYKVPPGFLKDLCEASGRQL